METRELSVTILKEAQLDAQYTCPYGGAMLLVVDFGQAKDPLANPSLNFIRSKVSRIHDSAPYSRTGSTQLHSCNDMLLEDRRTWT